MEDSLNIWERHPAAELPQDQTLEEWFMTELDRTSQLSPDEDLEAFVSAGVGLLKALRAAGRSDLIVKACELDPDLVLTCVHGFPSQFPLKPEELATLLAHIEHPLWVTTLVAQHSQQILKWNPAELQLLPEPVRKTFDDPLYPWLVRHQIHPMNLKLARKIIAYGLPLESLLIWRHAHLPFQDQEKALDRLERSTPGMAAQLFERFNILNFARYPISHLQRQYEADESGQLTFGWIFFSSGDNSGGLRSSARFLSSASLQPGTWLFEVHDVEATWPKVRRILGERGKGHFLVFHSHANKCGFELLPRLKSLEGVDFERFQIGTALRALLYPGSPILLGGCGTGQEGGVAEQIATLGFDVYASQAVESKAQFRVTPHGMPTVLHLAKGTDFKSLQPCTRFIPGASDSEADKRSGVCLPSSQ